MKHQGMSALLVVGGVPSGGAFSPAAQARPTCQEFDDTTICETTGSVSIKAEPGTRAAPPASPAIPFTPGAPNSSVLGARGALAD